MYAPNPEGLTLTHATQLQTCVLLSKTWFKLLSLNHIRPTYSEKLTFSTEFNANLDAFLPHAVKIGLMGTEEAIAQYSSFLRHPFSNRTFLIFPISASKKPSEHLPPNQHYEGD